PLLMRRISSAFARSPAASVSAFLHSIMPSPVRWRRSITMLAAISAMSLLRYVTGRVRRVRHRRRMRPAQPGSRLSTRPRAAGTAPLGRRVVGHLDEFLAGLDDFLDHVASALEDRIGG